MWLAAEVGALGVVFGDIGTSPLYAFKTALAALGTGQPSVDDVLGLLSLVVWALTLSVTLKYVTVVLRADNDGEGGILALITLLNLHRSTALPKRVLLGIGLFGAAMLFGDGMLTPAISVLSAVEGLQVFTPSMQTLVVPLTVGILLALFVSQRFGTEGIGRFFGPVMLVWFATIGVFGVIEMANHPSVLLALNPIYGIKLLMHHTRLAGEILGAVFLVLTGGEALYADLGHFGRKAISRAWLVVAMPAIMLNYFGQGALVLSNPLAAANPVLRARAQIRRHRDGGAGDGGDHHREPGDHHGLLQPRQAGGRDRLSAADGHALHLAPHAGPCGGAARQPLPRHRHARASSSASAPPTASPPLMASRCRSR